VSIEQNRSPLGMRLGTGELPLARVENGWEVDLLVCRTERGS
jgi:hypothetical protein